MVYDVPRNFVGDAHWRQSEDLQDGDEIMLEKRGVLVQVAESVGTTETDLTELRNSRKKPAGEQHLSPTAPSVPPGLQTPRATGVRSSAPLKHRSLNTLLGTSKGPLGKATVPSRSPFEQRRECKDQPNWQDDRPTKRPRLETSSSCTVSDRSKAAKPRPSNASPSWNRTANVQQRKRPKAQSEPCQQSLGTEEIIDLCDDTAESQDKFLNGFSSDALAPQSPPQKPTTRAPNFPIGSSARSSSPAFQIQETPADIGRRQGHEISVPCVSKPSAVAHPRIETYEVAGNIDKEPCVHAQLEYDSNRKDDDHVTQNTRSKDRESNAANASIRHTSRSLRLASSVSKKRRLLCQDQLTRLDLLPTSQSRQLNDRLAKIEAKEQRSFNLEQSDAEQHKHPVPHRTSNSAVSETNTPVQSHPHLVQLEEPAAVLGNVETSQLEPPLPLPPAAIAPSITSPRILRRTVSENSPGPRECLNHAPGALTRITPSPAKKGTAPGCITSDAESPTERHNRKSPSRTRPKARQPPKRTVSLSVLPSGTSAVLLSRPFQAPKAAGIAEPLVAVAREPEPWSREAFDLFEWRPPGWDEENWCVRADSELTAVGA